MKYSNILLGLLCVLGVVLIAMNIQRKQPGDDRKRVVAEMTVANFFSYDGEVINSSVYLQNLQQAHVPLKQVFDSAGYKLAFVLTDVQCDVCVEYVVGQLDSLIHAQPALAGKIVMLAGYDSWIQFNRYVKIKKINLPVYQFAKSEIDVTFTSLSKPALLLLAKDLTTRYVFIPDKSEPVLFGKYLHFAEKMLLPKT